MAEYVNPLTAFLPKQSTSGSSKTTETTQTQLSEEAINEIIRGMMESDSGLSRIMMQQSGSGLYNASTSQLLANDLASRVAGKAALASAPTTKTVKQKGSAPGASIDPKYALGMQLLSEILGGGQPKGGQAGKGLMGGIINPVMDWMKKQTEAGAPSGLEGYSSEDSLMNFMGGISDFGTGQNMNYDFGSSDLGFGLSGLGGYDYFGQDMGYLGGDMTYDFGQGYEEDYGTDLGFGLSGYDSGSNYYW